MPLTVTTRWNSITATIGSGSITYHKQRRTRAWGAADWTNNSTGFGSEEDEGTTLNDTDSIDHDLPALVIAPGATGGWLTTAPLNNHI